MKNMIEKIKTISIEKALKKTVGDPINKNTKIQKFKNGILTIKVSNPVWRNELQLQIKEIIQKIKNEESSLLIKEIKLK